MNIQITKQGDTIETQSNVSADMNLNYGLLSHRFCSGFIDINQISKTHQSFSCRRCNFRFVFPLVLNTWNKLRKYLKSTPNGREG